MEVGDSVKTDLCKDNAPDLPTSPIYATHDSPNHPLPHSIKAEGTHTLRDIGSFVKDICSFFKRDSFSDVSIRVGSSSYAAHKFILAKSSRVFQTMLYGEAWTSNLKCDLNCSLRRDELVLEETDECVVVFEGFLRYLYSAEVEVALNSAVGLLCLADKYEVESLKGLLVAYMVQWARSPRINNALLWYNWAKLIGLPELREQCFRTIAWNFGEVVRSDDWIGMELDFLIDFISSSELVVHDESVVLDAVQRWMGAEDGRLERHADTLLPLVRFPMMLVSQLYQLEQTSKLLSDLCSQAYRFRAVCPSQEHLGAIFTDESYLPRDFTYLAVDQVRIHNTMRFGIQSDVKATRSPVPSDMKEADWKITYRKQAEMWSIQLYCLDSALNNGETRVQLSVVLYNQQDQVLHVHREDMKTCNRGGSIILQCIMPANSNLTTSETSATASHLAIILKPVAL